MESLPVWAQASLIAVLLLLSAFFSASETSMMALNRHRLKFLAQQNALGARTTQSLLGRTEQLLSVILIGNNLLNTIIPVLTTSIALSLFGSNKWVLSITTGIVAFLIIVVSEITPKIIGATFPERFALPASLVIKPLMRVAAPLVWFVNLFARALLFIMRIDTRGGRDTRMSSEEIRTIVLESSAYMPNKHRNILLNLFDLDNISVDDVMVPRARIEGLDLNAPFDEILQQLETCYHNKLIVYDGDIDRVAGVLQVRKTVAPLHKGEFNLDVLRELLSEPYFIPNGAPVAQQLQYFQENRHGIGLVVNEYGEVLGLLTPDDIIEELIGEFNTTLPRSTTPGGWNDQGECIVAGGMPLRELNRWLHLHLPVDGPKTLNGLILEALTEIPEGPMSLEVGSVRMEVMQIDNQAIKTVKLFRPKAKGAAPRGRGASAGGAAGGRRG